LCFAVCDWKAWCEHDSGETSGLQRRAQPRPLIPGSRAAVQPRLVAAADRRLRKRTQTKNTNGFNATVVKGVYGDVRMAATAPATPASIWQNEVKNLNDFNTDLNPAPSLPRRPQML
jgi:hypothetical protein